ncbi:hypothetical protein SS50377_24592 [Spironucleus salmonicida]|uniref:Uncharacterized protein n=1 Tax=Spironucleus salmonicida TaxID=348837 RepID=A0A9P8RXC6_9EUKA|nr:hypothetical protein SS50377_24592 [Spironucleus salmonicida]
MEVIYGVGPVLLLLYFITPNRKTVFKEFIAKQEGKIQLRKHQILFVNNKLAKNRSYVKDDYVKIINVSNVNIKLKKIYFLLAFVLLFASFCHYLFLRNQRKLRHIQNNEDTKVEYNYYQSVGIERFQ